MARKQNEYKPQSVSHPGLSLREKLAEMKMGPKEFAVRTGKPEKTISMILAGESSITPEMAVIFEDVLKIPAHLWLNRQARYDEFMARKKRDIQTKDAKSWAMKFPYKRMVEVGWVQDTEKPEEKARSLFHYFSVGSKEAFENYYFHQKLKSTFHISLEESNEPYACAAWLRQGELQAWEEDTPEYDRKAFEEKLKEIRNLIVHRPENALPLVQELCKKAGVKTVCTTPLPGVHLQGATRWVGEHPVIQLSHCEEQDKSFWFSFFHNAGHILKHGKKHIALEGEGFASQDPHKEKEADAFAQKWLSSPDES